MSLLGISEAAENIGFRTMEVSISFKDLQKIILPCIVHWNQSHFVVVYKIRKMHGKIYIYVTNPAAGKIKYTKEEFCRCWISSKHQNKNIGIALILEPGPEFLEYENEKIEKKDLHFYSVI